jgi:cell division protein FtsZ
MGGLNIMTKEQISNDMNENEDNAVIKVVGVGGGGGNSVDLMVEQGNGSAEYIIVNTDQQALNRSKVKPENRILIGSSNGGKKKGLGAGANPEVGRKAAEESKDKIAEALRGADLVFITAGMGGGTGTGAAPVVAKIAKDVGVECVVAVVTTPFTWEGMPRMESALKGRAELYENCDGMITVSNDRIGEYLETIKGHEDMNFVQGFKEADKVLLNAVNGTSEMINIPGIINLDFADVSSIMQIKGSSLMGIGLGEGENRVHDAVKRAIAHPLLEHDIQGAKGIIYNVVGGTDFGMKQLNEISEMLYDHVDPKTTKIIAGAAMREGFEGKVQVTIIATGFELREPVGKGRRNGHAVTSATSSISNEKPEEKTSSNSDLSNSLLSLKERLGIATDLPSWMDESKRNTNQN